MERSKCVVLGEVGIVDVLVFGYFLDFMCSLKDV